MSTLLPPPASFRRACAIALGIEKAGASKAAGEAVVPSVIVVNHAGAMVARTSPALHVLSPKIAKVRAAGFGRCQSCYGSNAGTVPSRAVRQYHQAMGSTRYWYNKAIDTDAQQQEGGFAAYVGRRSSLR